MWWRPAWFSLKGKGNIRGQRRELSYPTPPSAPITQPIRAPQPPVREQHRWLGQILRGHYRYYGVICNYRAFRVFKDCVVRLWRKVLGKRSQKGRVSWASYKSILTAFPLREPVLHQ